MSRQCKNLGALLQYNDAYSLVTAATLLLGRPRVQTATGRPHQPQYATLRAGLVISRALAHALVADGTAAPSDVDLSARCAALAHGPAGAAGCALLHAPHAFPLTTLAPVAGPPACAAVVPWGALKLDLLKV
jgi:hypothetical protein